MHPLKTPEGANKKAPVCLNQQQVTLLSDLTHSDISGKISITSGGSAHCFAAFIDEATENSVVYFLVQQKYYFQAMKLYMEMVENEMRSIMLSLRLDRAGETKSKALNYLALKRDMKLQFNPAHSHESKWRRRTTYSGYC